MQSNFQVSTTDGDCSHPIKSHNYSALSVNINEKSNTNVQEISLSYDTKYDQTQSSNEISL